MVMGTITDAAPRRLAGPPPLISSSSVAVGEADVSAQQELPPTRTTTATATRVGSHSRRRHIIVSIDRR
jgi:hypothetical protein